MMVLSGLLLIGVMAYWAVLEFLRLQWQRKIHLPAEVDESAAAPPFISLIVVCRNEAANLPLLFEALEQQQISSQSFELHLVDDASTDASWRIAEHFQQQASFSVQLHALMMPKKGDSPKKAAISQVLPQTKGSVIVVTDGDCQPAAGWLKSITDYWQLHQPVFVSGPVCYVGEQSLFDRLQVLDFAALIGVGGAMLKAGMPGMCNAANMAFSKKAFYAVGGYAGNEHVPSGDDEFLLQKLAVKYKDRLHFLGLPEAVVSTSPCSSWKAFVQQRKRWAGKWRLHKGLAAKMPALAVFVFYLLLLASLFLPFFVPAAAPLVLLAWLIKAFADYRFLHPVVKLLGKRLSPGQFLLMELLYPVYVLFFAVAANRGGFTWKDRSYRYTTSSHERRGISGIG